jgi:hypothetical protein
MNTRFWIRGCLLTLLTSIAACAPISAEKVAATARPVGQTGQAEHFWKADTEQQLDQQIDPIEAACLGSVGIVDCRMMRLSKAWPTATEYQTHCISSGPLKIVAQCLLEYDFWAKMGRKYYPSYRIRESWASFNLTDNPTWREWFVRRLMECDPKLNKGQEVGDACVGDRAKRDFGITYDATKGCYYDNPSLAFYCYWMAGFDVFVREQIKLLESGA